MTEPALGVVVRTPLTTVLDTRELPWEPHWSEPGGMAKVLTRGESGFPLVYLVWLPESNTAQPAPGGWSRWLRSTGVRVLVLGGDLAVGLLDSRDNPPASRVVLKEGYWLDLRPGAWSALDTPPSTRGSFFALVMRDVAAHSTKDDLDVAVNQEAVPDAYGVAMKGVNVTVIDTRAQPWSPHFGMAVGRTKVLASSSEGRPLAFLTRTPPVASAPDVPGQVARRYHRTISERIFVLGGELMMREWSSVNDHEGQSVLLKPGLYVDRLPGSIHFVESRSAVGFASLEVRSGIGNYANDPNYDTETLSY